ncbi:winged helix-turn-helix domain-containing protein [Pantoea stewartii]|uniref:winged helix-turn-helix domain-containing protein n=1 Tax=Pantoea stewartii TaxID=66269 RepID=UPI001CF7A4EB|nr:winged helix-turn-helix domain-containing protein [Pantoea stewartii]NRH23226.1 hypothetical protein [Pantoea stewartii]
MSRKITLNEYLVFEPDKKTISHKDRKTTIGASASMCLELLIENVGRLVTHQQFYDYVWRRFGTEPASTSIYQNISALRRALIKIGYEEDIIRTMPRKGFLLSPKTTIMKENIGVSLSFTDQSEATQKLQNKENNEMSGGKEPAKKSDSDSEKLDEPRLTKLFFQNALGNGFFYVKRLSYKNLVLPLTIIFVVFFVYYFFYLRVSMRADDETFTYSTEYKDCTLFSKTDAFMSKSDVTKMAEKLDIDCKNTPYVYLTAYKNADRLSYFLCERPLNSNVRANCHSYYYVKNFYDE